MRSDHLKRHMKIHDKHGEVEPLPSYVPPASGSSGSFYRLTSMDEEVLLKKMLKCDREY